MCSSLIDDLATMTIESRSEPSAIADRRTDEVDSEKVTESQGPAYVRDSAGELFDADIHTVDAGGNPKETKAGKWAKKRGRPAGNANTKKVAADNSSQQLGRATAFLIFATGQTIFGDEWAPVIDPKQGIDEERVMRDAWAEYYLATGKEDLPPWAGVAVVCVSYALSRINKPQTKEKLTGFAGWIQNWKAKRAKRNADNAT